MSFDRAEAIATMVADAQAFYRFGWMLGTSGNLSIRVDARKFLITASGRNKGALTEDDFLVCSVVDGFAAERNAPKPSAETLVHAAIYRRRPEAGAIYHVHEPHAALVSSIEPAGATFENWEMLKGLGIWDRENVRIPCVPNYADIPSLADAVEATLSDEAPAVMIERHGYYAWGQTPFEARRHTETLAYLYRVHWETAMRA